MAEKMQAPPSWWAERWMRYATEALLLGLAPSPQRLKRARGAEAKLSLARGAIAARVVGGSSIYTATLKIKPLGQRDWRRVLDAVAADPTAAQRLLAGNPGPELENAFAGVGVPLFPPPTGMAPLRCTCAQPLDCRHTVVLLAQVADLLAGNPLLWLEVLGQPRAEVLAAVRGRLADRGVGEQGQAQADLDPERFWQTTIDPDGILVRPGDALAPDALLRRLGPLPLSNTAIPVKVEREVTRYDRSFRTWDLENRTAEALLRQYTATVGRAAAALSRGERSPEYQREALPGKAIPLGYRVAVEVVEAVNAVERPLGVAELVAASPTAAALPGPQAQHAVEEALPLLPPEVVVLGERVGPRAAFLAGARFRHVITFAEWRTGRLATDSDWLLALGRLGCVGPYAVQVGSSRIRIPEMHEQNLDSLFALGYPGVGEELELRVVNPAEPLLFAKLHHPGERSLAGRDEANAAAVQVLRQYMEATHTGRLQASEAVGLLLGAGAYRRGVGPDPVWLLPAAADGLYHVRGGRDLIRESWWGWKPTFGRLYTRWPEQQQALSWFAAALAQAGWSFRDQDAALNCVRWWCQHWPSAQDRPVEYPPLAALLHFLWIAVPLEARRQKAQVERVPEFLAAWFRFLGEQNPAMADLYQEHIAACQVPGAFAHRLQTRPRNRAEEAAWRLEGYLWMGPDLYLS